MLRIRKCNEIRDRAQLRVIDKTTLYGACMVPQIFYVGFLTLIIIVERDNLTVV